MKTMYLILGLVMVMAFGCAAFAQGIDVPIVNGSFEGPVVAGWSEPTIPTGWTGSGLGDIGLYYSTTYARDGVQAIQINSYTSGLYQTLAATAHAGSNYEMNLWVDGANNSYKWVTAYIVLVNPSNPNDAFTIAGRTDLGTQGWNYESVGSVAVAEAYDGWNLQVNIGGGYGWTGIDNVSLTEYAAAPVPEPGSLAALFVGLVGLTGHAIRRRR